MFSDTTFKNDLAGFNIIIGIHFFYTHEISRVDLFSFICRFFAIFSIKIQFIKPDLS
jgi:hypothetical protein